MLDGTVTPCAPNAVWDLREAMVVVARNVSGQPCAERQQRAVSLFALCQRPRQRFMLELSCFHQDFCSFDRGAGVLSRVITKGKHAQDADDSRARSLLVFLLSKHSRSRVVIGQMQYHASMNRLRILLRCSSAVTSLSCLRECEAFSPPLLRAHPSSRA